MDFESAKQKAVRYLVIAKKTEHEVAEKLKKSGYTDEIIDKVISYLKELNYINDVEYVDAYTRQCMRLLNYSIFEIKQKLLQKGIKRYIIESRLDNLSKTDYETNLVTKLLNGKCKDMEQMKKNQYLYRRGLSSKIDYDI